jgi:hypothetical protein
MWADDLGFVSIRDTFFLLATASRLAVGCPQTLYQMDISDCFPGNKVALHEARLSPLSDDDVLNAWSRTSTPPYVFVMLD